MSERRRAAHGQGGVYAYTTSDGKRLYRVTYPVVDPLTGARRATNKRGFTSQKEAIAFRSAALAAAQKGQSVRPKKITFDSYCEEWLARQRIADSTRHSYGSKLRLYVQPRLGAHRLDKITTAQIDLLYRDLEGCGGQGGRPLSAKSVRYTHVVLHKLLGQAVRDGVIPSNPADLASPPSAREAASPEMKTWTAEQVSVFLAGARQHRLYALFVVYATTGMRRGEALGLKWSDVDLDASRLAVRRAVTETAGRVAVGPTKTGRARVVELDAATVAALRAHRAAQAAERLSKGAHWKDQDWVFAHDGRGITGGHAGGVLQPDSVWRLFKNLVRTTNATLPANRQLPDIRLHDLRHSWATLALQANVHVKVVQERLGHTTPQITLAVYSHVSPTMQAEAAASVASAIFGATS